MESGTQMTLEQWKPEACPVQIAGVSDSLVRISPLQENNSVFQEDVQVCFSQLQDLLKTSKKKIDPECYLLRTLKTYLVLIEGLILPNFSLNWTKSGTMQNGVFLTPKILEYRRTGKECSLLDILEEEVDEKYFLSEKQTEYITNP
ncbi:hypothetical protein CE91St54_66570 [Hungatella hathewayi]|uniref:Uncharacterized protein n=1 Tax=Hungatella hathewayi TaxID=154046 RepID=A0AA37JJ77_9FIRM|nr:hypothetical protein CE91St55_40540 [Hungatella hathewayi]GKH11549.1 hypothetical protein CE91St54_66570 [Hungatella hathewayi]